MKKLLIIPALIFLFTPAFANTVLEEQAAACISENGSNQAGLESCLSKLYVPAFMDCDELLEVHRAIIKSAQGRNNATIRAVTRVSSKLAIISLSANCYSPDVAARFVARAGGGSGIVADATVSGAVDAAENLGVDSGSLANSASNITDDGGGGGDGGGINTTLPTPLKFTTTTKLM